jgi:uncharacterized protein YxjI
MQTLSFPLQFTFKVSTLSNDFVAKDANEQTIAYVRQKLLKLISEVTIYSDETRSDVIYQINANKWIDFSATYVFTDRNGRDKGRIARKGWASIWKAHYEIYDENQVQDLVIQEDNAWVKVADAFLNEIPILGIFTGYLFNPSYSVTRPDGTVVARLKKQPSFWGRKFSVEKLGEFEPGEGERILLGLMMMVLLERRRG